MSRSDIAAAVAAAAAAVCGVLSGYRRSVNSSNFAVVVFLAPFPNGLHNTMRNFQDHGRSTKLKSKVSLSLCQTPPLEGTVWPMSIRTIWVSVQVRSKGGYLTPMIGAALEGCLFHSPRLIDIPLFFVGFYVDATEEPYKPHYQMYSYVTKELPELLEKEFQLGQNGLRSITGQ